MAKKKLDQGLQIVTDSRLMRLLKHKRVTKDDMGKLTEDEKIRFGELSTDYMSKLTPDQRDEFLEKIRDVTAEPTISGMWQYNHAGILYAISSLLQETGRMPKREEIAERAKVSRKTVYEHLRDYATHPLYLEQMQKFRFLSERVLAEVCKAALQGDSGSQKLFFNVMGMLNNGNGTTQNIQINGLTINQAIIQRLQPDQLAIIEGVLKSVVPDATEVQPIISHNNFINEKK